MELREVCVNVEVTRCISLFRFFVRNDLTKQYVAYEFETSSVCSPDINLQIRTSWLRQTIASALCCSVIMSTFVPEKRTFAARIAFLISKRKRHGKSSFAGRITMVNTLHRLAHVWRGFDNLKLAISMWKTKTRRRRIGGVTGWWPNPNNAIVNND